MLRLEEIEEETYAETKNYCYLLYANLLLKELILTISIEEEIIFRKVAANIMWSLILIFGFAIFLPIYHLAKSFQRFPEFWTKQ